MTDFDALQRAVQASAAMRQAEAQSCEGLLTALYQAFRHASGPGLPLNNVSMEAVAVSDQSLRPLPLGSWYAATFRLGLCEVRVQVRRDGADFVGEYGGSGQFRLHWFTESEMLALGRHILRRLAEIYDADAQPRRLNN